MDQTNQVAVVLIEDEAGRVILQLRDDKPGLIHANMYSFFGGAVESDESPSAAALRELSEELSIPTHAARLSFLWRTVTHHHGREYDLHVFHYRIGPELAQVLVTEGQGMGVFAPAQIKGWRANGHAFSDVAQNCLSRFWREKPAPDR